ncbi:Hpt domain-containing protein [Curvibacter sp. CHRR-16]|uniref:ATP-binding protein n=1 Tax=Curvibacter sp. CHRR-16 TaxID=2835872 RepID=UPI001BDADC21|nr:ATP-binding protein [Curvibacter sp. CHRR-16]MBT0571681.1 Hpt domain-containing protein [Curvibacter sp. CHRR-16]
MNIRQRILLLIGLSFLALLFTGGFAVLQNTRSSKEVQSVTEGVVPSSLKSVELMGQLKDVQIATMGMVDAPDKAAILQMHEELKKKKADLQRALDDQMVSADNDIQRGLIKQAQESLQNYFASIDDTANFMLQGQKELAQATMAATVDQYLREQISVIETVQVEKRRSKDDAIAAVNGNLRATTSTLSVVTLLAIVALGVMGLLLYRQVIHPIGDMETKMTEIATSQDFTHRVPVARMDEIGKSVVAFNAMIEKIQQSNEKIRQKTADIHAMLHYIPQGILTIEGGGIIHPEFSEHLKTVLETNDIAGRNVMHVVFDGSGLGLDALNQMETAISACIGEDVMNFEFNVHLLPHEIVKPMPDGRTKILDLNWSPITDESGTTLRLLLCLRDVTDLRALTQAADAQKKELALIGEILGVHQEKFEEFIDSANRFLTENGALIDSVEAASESARQDAVAVLFRNMHTIKGNARTYGLLQLTDLVHQAEERYDRIRHGQQAWDTPLLQTELKQVAEMVAHYARINDVTLGRKVGGRHASSTPFVQVPQEVVNSLIERLEKAGMQDAAQQSTTLQEARDVLKQLGAEPLSRMLSGVIQSLPSLAKELGKDAPQVVVQEAGILVRTQLANTLGNVFMHLYRNALDHGLELPAERVAMGKPQAGEITLSAHLDAHALTLRLKDDGRGLALQRIKGKAIEQGLLDADAQTSAHDIAQLIFASGFSTANEVTEVSGRGVGMDAVRGFIQELGGDITLELASRDAQAQYCPFETVITLPAKFAVLTRTL